MSNKAWTKDTVNAAQTGIGFKTGSSTMDVMSMTELSVSKPGTELTQGSTLALSVTKNSKGHSAATLPGISEV